MNSVECRAAVAWKTQIRISFDDVDAVNDDADNVFTRETTYNSYIRTFFAFYSQRTEHAVHEIHFSEFFNSPIFALRCTSDERIVSQPKLHRNHKRRYGAFFSFIFIFFSELDWINSLVHVFHTIIVRLRPGSGMRNRHHHLHRKLVLDPFWTLFTLRDATKKWNYFRFN